MLASDACGRFYSFDLIVSLCLQKRSQKSQKAIPSSAHAPWSEVVISGATQV
jgi:hypothetical protein